MSLKIEATPKESSGLNGEDGVNPSRLRHCVWGVGRVNATAQRSEREGIGPAVIRESGDLPGEIGPALRQQMGFTVGFARAL